jgi:hypothetical protein
MRHRRRIAVAKISEDETQIFAAGIALDANPLGE